MNQASSSSTNLRKFISGSPGSLVEPINIFWTGGWDSTFVLINTALHYGKLVKPIYLLDEDRPSTLHELRAMKAIKSQVMQKVGSESINILPTSVTLVSNVNISDQLIDSYHRVQKQSSIGSQYLWMAAFCESQNLDNVVMAVHKDDRATSAIFALQSLIESIPGSQPQSYKLSRRADHDPDLYSIFRFYQFPLLPYTKNEMLEESRKHGFDELMSLTWFCHQPINDRPCGRCNPCKTTRNEGLGWRLPEIRKRLFSFSLPS